MPSALHIFAFSLHNPYALSWDPDSPFRALIRLLTTKNIPINDIDLSHFTGKRVLITGATGGCGLECAKALARAGSHLVLTARSQNKGDALRKEIYEDGGVSKETRVGVLELDMGSYDSIRKFRERLPSEYEYLDAAIMNAGVYCTEFGKCETGMEEITQVNFLSTVAISLITLPLLKAPSATPSRLLFISSEAHCWSKPRQRTLPDLLNNLNDPNGYRPWMRYHISKLLLVLWTKELSTRLNPEKVLVASASSNFTRTGMFRGFSHKFVAGIIERSVCRTAEQGAAQNLMAFARMSPDEDVNGGFWSDGMFRRPATAASTDIAKELRESMWDGLIGVLPEDLTRSAEGELSVGFPNI